MDCDYIHFKINKKEELIYPLPIAAYFPALPLTKKVPAMPPNTALAMIDAPTTPLASR
ncbi:MAG: hypothetical protein OEY17_06470 [Nitrosopumilus sp.]|nr:hypothetical protein [Nitrosopumilus sp.]MDH5658968.1 hypothetical protein [Nitrosopumilus sp.]